MIFHDFSARSGYILILAESKLDIICSQQYSTDDRLVNGRFNSCGYKAFSLFILDFVQARFRFPDKQNGNYKQV